MPSCFIHGVGLVTAQGVGVPMNWQRLLEGRVLHQTGVVPLERDRTLPRVSQLAIHAATEAWTAAGRPHLDDARTALVVGTSKGPIEDWIDQLDGRRPPDVTLGVARVASDVAAAVGHNRGPRLTYAGACASGLHAMIRAADLIKQGTCDRALVVAAEASTHALFAENFRRLGVLARDADGCRPYDESRRGFLLAEAAAAVWLTNRPSPTAVRLGPSLVLADATHLTGPDRQGATLRRLLTELNVAGVDLIHGHGTGTLLNDAVELEAIAATLGPGVTDVTLYSHKHAVGHTQGAAGLIGVVLNVSMHRANVALGNSHSRTPVPRDGQCRLMIPQTSSPQSIRRSLVVASGFGGTIAGVDLASRADGEFETETP